MLRALWLSLTVLVLPSAYVSADTPSDPSGNAALKYWQAFATMPKLTDAEQNRLAEYPAKPLDAHSREIVSQAEYALKMMRRAAALRQCDWGISFEEDGVFVLLPQGSAARLLTSLARLRARMRFEAGQLEAKTIKDLKMRLDALPPFGSQVTALLACERTTLDWFVRRVKEKKDKESLLAFFSWVGLTEGKDRDSGAKARAFLQECGGTAEGVIKFANETLPSYELLAKKLDLPLDEFDKEFKRESAKQAGNPVYKVFFPALAKVRQAKARADVRRALFSAALAVQLDGKDALKDHPDPVVGGSFDYVAFEGGFELRSKFKTQDDKPVTLTVGRRGN